MTGAQAVLLLRLYPRTWRMRYEEEVRVLLDDRAPGWSDLAGLVRGAGREWIHTLADPIEHPIVAFAIDVLAGWMGAVMAIYLVANLFAGLLSSVLGEAPGWIATLSSVAVVAAAIRGFGPLFNLHQIPIGVHGRTLAVGPLSPRQARRWWTLLSVAVVLGHWAGDIDLVAAVACPIMFSSGTEKARRRQRAHDELMRLRRELQAVVRERARLHGLLPIHLSTSAELDQISADVARLNREVRAAADAWRHALPIGGA
jgi:hypothetical protein